MRSAIFFGMRSQASVVEVVTKAQRRAFVHYPFTRYALDPCWVPPLRSSLRQQFDPARNPFLLHCDHALFLLVRDGRIAGRIAALVDRLAVDDWGEPIGMFAYFECGDEDDREGAVALFDAARAWLRAQGITKMRGPWSFVSQEWGLVVEGFTPRPVIMAPYNPPGYGALVEAAGLRKVKDLLCWELSIPDGYTLPERFLRLTDAIAARQGLRIRSIDMSDYDREAESFSRLSIETLKDNWGFSPITDAEIKAMARDLRTVLRPSCVLFATNEEGRDVGFALTIPDVNEILVKTRGRMLPFGWARLLWGIPKLKRYRMFGLGVSRDYRGKGVDALLYRGVWEAVRGPETTMEINYVLEDNAAMVNAVNKLGGRPSRRYRVYEAEI